MCKSERKKIQLIAFQKSNTKLEGVYITRNYNADETITATYVMADYKFDNKSSGVFGLRMEHTNISYIDNQFENASYGSNIGTPTPNPNSIILKAVEAAIPAVTALELEAIAISMLTTIGSTQAEDSKPAPVPITMVPPRPWFLLST